MEHNEFTERRRCAPVLTEEQIEVLAEKAAEKAVEKIIGDVYKQIGRTLIEKLFWLIGAVVMGFGVYLNSKGLLK